MTTIQKFDQVMTETCAFPTRSMTYKVIHATMLPGGKLEFTREEKTGHCQ